MHIDGPAGVMRPDILLTTDVPLIPMSGERATATAALGLGRVKTPAPAARVEYLGGFAHHESQVMLRSAASYCVGEVYFPLFADV
jgi:hypothetical protein